jgi:WD40 repeat protein
MVFIDSRPRPDGSIPPLWEVVHDTDAVRDQPGRPRCTVCGGYLPPLAFVEDSPVNAVTVSPDNQRIVTAGRDGTAKVWDARTGQRLPVVFKQGGAVLRVALSSDGQYLVTTGVRSAILWKTQTGRLETKLDGHTQGVYSPYFSRDGHSL